MDKRFWAIVGVIIALFVGFVVLGRDDSNSSSSNAQPTSNVKGEGTTVTLVEYSDFQCPACAQYYPIVEQVIDKYGDQIQFQYRHFPLRSIHPNAFAASRASEAAAKQDKFWEMYDRLFAGQNDWSTAQNPNSIFETYAQQIELDIEQYRTDFASREVNDAINADIRAGEELGVNSTPTFFLNGEQLRPAPNSLEAFSELIDQALESDQAPQE